MSKVIKISRALVLAGSMLIFGCAEVRLVESNDPKIEEGMMAYQELLETFVQQTLVNYELCSINHTALVSVERMPCDAATPEVQALCEAEIESEREQLAQATDESCAAASFREAQRNFYIPQEARLNVLKTRASVLDSMGACAAAINGMTKLVGAVVPDRVKGALNSLDENSGAPNCTVVLVSAVLENHRELANGHQDVIDQIELDDCDSQLSGACTDHVGAAKQAGLYMPTMLETLIQNVRIVLLIEEAKKRGQDGA